MKFSLKTSKQTLMVPALLAGGFALGSLAPHAQTAPQKVAFVNVPDVLKAHPDNAAVVAIQTKANTELKGYDDQIKAIQAKGASATAADKEKMNQLIKTAQGAAQSYQKQITDKSAPIEKAVDGAIAAAAKANGVAIVMDKSTAAQSGLVVYADDSTDITAAVTKSLKK